VTAILAAAPAWSAMPPTTAPHPALPDPLRLDGAAVTTAAQWSDRRAQVRAILADDFIGTAPPPPGNLVATQLDARPVRDGAVLYRRLHLGFGPGHAVGFDVAVFTPDRSRPLPVIVNPSFSPTPGDAVGTPLPHGRRVLPEDVDPDRAAARYADALGRGYAVVTFNYQQCAADTAQSASTGFLAAYPGYTWGSLGAWAWGMSRCADYVTADPASFDPARVLAVGHSRLGKATLVAGAFDDRFALVAPAGAGCAGTAAFRFCGPGRGGKEGIESYLAHFPWQVTPAFLPYAHAVDRLPFDQNWLIALVAPRPFIAADSYDDAYCNSDALLHSIAGARPVYDLLGADANLAVHFRHGPHALADEDWTAILDFADAALARRPATRP
jgi:hypothetical protein